MIDTTVTFNAALSSICINILTLNDSLVEETEVFTVRINSTDSAITIGEDSEVLITDSNMREVLVTFDQSSYQVIEGEVASVCVNLTSNPLNLDRNVEIMLSTVSSDAEGKTNKNYAIAIGEPSCTRAHMYNACGTF